MQIKTTMRCYFTAVRMAIINKSINNKCWWGCGEKRNLVHCWWECRLVQPLWKTAWSFLKKLQMELPFDPVIPLLGLYPENPETLIQMNLCTLVFIVVLFKTAKCRKQPKCPSVNKCIKKLVHLHNGILCSRKEKGTPTLRNSMDGTGEPYAKWNKTKYHMMKDKYHMISPISGI